MGTRTTKIPAIKRTRDVPSELHQILEAIKQLLETREGLRGDPLDRFVTVRELRTMMDSDHETVVKITEAVDHGGLLGLGDDDHTQYYNSTRLNAWTGSTSVVTLGTITTGTWHGTAISNEYISGIDQDLLTTSSPTFSNLTVNNNLGVGVSSPSEQLDVAGAIKMGNTSSSNAGTIRWTGSDFQGYTGSTWVSMTSGGTGGGSPLYQKGDLYTYSTTDDRLGVGTDGQFLSADSSTPTGLKWTNPAGGGDVSGPSSAINNNVVFFDGTTGKLIKDSGLTLSGNNTGDQDLSGLVPYSGASTNLDLGAHSITTAGFTLTTSPSAGYVLTSDASGVGTWQAPAGSGLPSGTSGQTLRHDGTNWVATSLLFNNGTNVGIGSTGPSEKLDIDGAVKLGTTTNTNAGTIRWTGSDFEGYTGSDWLSLTSGGTGTGSLWTQAGSDIYYNTGKVGIGSTSPGAKLDVQGQIIGGFGAVSTGGTTDWNDTSNARPGSGYTLLYGDATNGPGPHIYFHPFGFEYNTKDGSGNITQFAIPYGYTSGIDAGLYVRGRYGGTWSNWTKIISQDTLGFLYLDSSSTRSLNLQYHSYANTYINAMGGKVGIGTTFPNQLLTIEGTMSLKEQSAANADEASYGQIWVRNDTPNKLYYTDDAGNDIVLSSHPLDAPSELYTHGAGIDWISKIVAKHLGVIYWQTIDGALTIETFEDYNQRRKNEPGHTDLVKQDWVASHREQVIKRLMKEEIEIPQSEAIENVEVVKKVEQAGEPIHEHVFNEDTGKVEVITRENKVWIEEKTGKIKKRIKSGVTLNPANGKFYRRRTRAEAEKLVTSKDIPEMPDWMKREAKKLMKKS